MMRRQTNRPAERADVDEAGAGELDVVALADETDQVAVVANEPVFFIEPERDDEAGIRPGHRCLLGKEGAVKDLVFGCPCGVLEIEDPALLPSAGGSVLRALHLAVSAIDAAS